MSLNGLDDPAIKEAHETAVSEPGGWFVLKYEGRDEVNLLSRGNGGIVEIRNAIAAYEEASPLYAYLKYRRRNVIIKYLPDGCSRLIQARVAVHFNAVCERFAPYDTTFSIATAKELKDTSLSAACSLHTSGGSIASSTSSLRRRRLMEIAEEEEEEQRATKRRSLGKEEEEKDEDNATQPDGASSVPKSSLDAPVTSHESSADASSAGRPSLAVSDRPPSPAKSFDTHNLSKQISASSDLYSYSSYYKPKVKLGPRPSADAEGRPRTSAGTGNYRPVSSIPAGFKLFSKGSRRGKDGVSSRSTAPSIKEETIPSESTGASGANTNAIPIPEIPGDDSNLLDILRRPTTSSGVSVKSGKSVATTATTATAKHNSMTPEKARLMKALKLREKRKKLSLQPPLPVPPIDIVGSSPTKCKETSAAEELPLEPVVTTASASDSLGSTTEDVEPDTLQPSKPESADSAIDVNLSAADQASLNTQTTDSHPASPLAMSSEIGDSTKASSLSESTDETVQAQHELEKPEADADTPHVEAATETTPKSVDMAISVVEAEAAEPSAVETRKAVEPIEQVEAVDEAHAVPESKSEETESPTVVEDKDAEEPRPEQQEPEPEALVHTEPRPELVHNVEHEDATKPTEDASVANMSEMEHENSVPVEEIPHVEAAAAIEPVQEPDVVTSNQEAEAPATPVTPPASNVYVSDSAIADTPETPETPVILPSIEEPDASETRSFADSDAISIDPKRVRRRAMIDPIQTDFPSVSDKDTIRTTETNLSEDEDLMDELQSATLQEAKPMMVSKSPVSAVFPNPSPSKQNGSNDSPSSTRAVRTVSNPIRGPLLAPGDVTTSSARSVSSGAAFLHKIAQQSSSSLAPKKAAHIGSSISQRIKALEKLSSSGAAPGAAETASRAERPSSVFYSVRKTSGRDSSRSPSIAERASTLAHDKTTPSPPDSRDSTYDGSKLLTRDRAGSMATRLSVFEGGNAPRGQPETIQVKARIIRDPAHPFPKAPEPHSDPTDMAPPDFKQSPLTVDHQRAQAQAAYADVPAPVELTETTSKRGSIQERRMSKEKRRSQSQDRASLADKEKDEADGSHNRRSSLTIVRDFIKERRGSVLGGRNTSTDNLNSLVASPGSASKSPSRPPSVHTTTGLARRLSISSRRSSMSKERDPNTPPLSTPLSPSLMTETSGSGDEGKSSSGEKGNAKSRTSRFMRRLSSSLGSNRKAGTPTISPTVAEEEEAAIPIPTSRGSSSVQPIISYMGDVNVQFPDNLLWKRRAMCLDSQGSLILSTVQGTASASGNEKIAGAVKRYHLSDFRFPYIPDLEIQELPNSVCLDFVDGPGLQIACEDRPGQLNILQTLQEAHQNHTTFGQ